jgi:DNA polymerase-1
MKKNTNKQLLVLLDAHAIIHRAYHAMPDFMTRDGRPTGAIYGFGMMVLKIIDEFQPDHIVACYDLPGPTFRHESFAAYKGGRSKTDEALKMQFNPTREMCEAFSIPTYDAPGFEADDVLGTITEQLKNNNDVQILIASGDMDTLQLVDGQRVQVYTLKRGLNDTITYDQKAVEERFKFSPLSIIDYKALRGDPSDNIPGIKGIGDKAATLLISKFKTIEAVYASLETGDAELLATGLTQRMIELIRAGREEAEFSKVIATIRLDAPITFVMPEHSWKDAVDIDRAIEIFESYELRSLPTKLRSSLGLSQLVQKPNKDISTLSEKELKETALKLWLIDSDETNAGLEEIKSYTGEKSAASAKESIDTQLHRDEKIAQVYRYIEEPLIPVIKNMEENGILVDQQFFSDLSKKYHIELDILAKKIHSLAGSEFNIKSPKQLSVALFNEMGLSVKGIKKSKTGSYSTNASILEKLHDEHEIIPLISEYRELDKLLGTYIDTIPTMVEEDKRLHAEFIQNGTVTGRFSSRNPNMQNIPTRTELGRKIREGFIASPGTLLVSLDYSQIELRCLALLSGDEALIDIFNAAQDIHSAVAALIGNVTIDKVDRDMRRKAKIVNFGILYGMGINSLKKEMNTTREEAQKFYDGFFTQFPKATAFLESTKDFARARGYSETLFGRRRQFKNINSKLGFIKAMAERMALNAPIQGTSADMIKLAMIQIHDWLEKEQKKPIAQLILQIHDEIVYQVKESFVKEFTQQAEAIMQSALKNSYLQYHSPVPLMVHSSQGIHWGALK